MSSPRLLPIDQCPVAEIEARGRLRPVSEAAVESLIASITELGVMKDAIHVRQIRHKGGALVLIAGAHRLEAAKRMGWETVPAKVWTDVTDDWARLMEIDDNLAGAEMNALDTAVFLATRKAVYERLHPETKQGVAGGLARQGLATDIVSFAASTAEKFGLSTRQIERIVAAGSRLGPDQVAALRQAPRPVTLKDLADIAKIGEATDRYAVVDRLSAGKAKSAADALRSLKAEAGGCAVIKDPVQEALKVLSTAWSRAPMAAKRRFIAEYLPEIEAVLERSDGRLEDAAE